MVQQSLFPSFGLDNRRSSDLHDEELNGSAALLVSISPLSSRRRRARITQREHAAASLVDRLRPPSLRPFDQIPMRTADHVRQIKSMVSSLAGQSVAFVGDSDGASLLLGLFGKLGHPLPARMCLFDFDDRLLKVARHTADSYGFGDRLETKLYNVFDRLPHDLLGQFDWFYTNPPYGSHNNGESARLFIARGIELVRPGGMGCIILPCDAERCWTSRAMFATQQFLTRSGWMQAELVREIHRYRLDDDPELTSSLLIVQQVGGEDFEPAPYAGRCVAHDEIPLFYGRKELPPYPRYIRQDETFDYGWSLTEVADHAQI